jgi:hypothetical protein
MYVKKKKNGRKCITRKINRRIKEYIKQTRKQIEQLA